MRESICMNEILTKLKLPIFNFGLVLAFETRKAMQNKGKCRCHEAMRGVDTQRRKNLYFFFQRQMEDKGRCYRYVYAQRTHARGTCPSLSLSPYYTTHTDVRTYSWVRLGRETRAPPSSGAQLWKISEPRYDNILSFSSTLKVRRNNKNTTLSVAPPIPAIMAINVIMVIMEGEW